MSNANTEQEKNVERTPYTVSFDQRPKLKFVGKNVYITSNELCTTANEVFHATFADYEGCCLEFGQGGEPTVTLFFNHGQYSSDQHVAVSRNTSNKASNELLGRIRQRDQLMKNGDRYYITDDGKDIITKLLTNRAFNNNKPNWGGLVAEHSDKNMYNMYNAQAPVQLTKIMQIDLNRLVAFIYGRKDEDGSDIDYVTLVTGVVNPIMGAPSYSKNYMLNINAVSADNVKSLCEKLGLGTMGSDIIR